jgi:hypothetical protein
MVGAGRPSTSLPTIDPMFACDADHPLDLIEKKRVGVTQEV